MEEEEDRHQDGGSVHGLAAAFGATITWDLGLFQWKLVVIRQFLPRDYPVWGGGGVCVCVCGCGCIWV